MSSSCLNISVIYMHRDLESVENIFFYKLIYKHFRNVSHSFLHGTVPSLPRFCRFSSWWLMFSSCTKTQILAAGLWQLLIFSQTSTELSVCSWNFRGWQQKRLLLVFLLFTFNPFHKSLENIVLGNSGIERKRRKSMFTLYCLSILSLFIQRKAT